MGGWAGGCSDSRFTIDRPPSLLLLYRIPLIIQLHALPIYLPGPRPVKGVV